MPNIFDNEALQERIAIKMDSHIPEHEAIRQAKDELPKEDPESVRKAKELQQRVRSKCSKPRGYIHG